MAFCYPRCWRCQHGVSRPRTPGLIIYDVRRAEFSVLAFEYSMKESLTLRTSPLQLVMHVQNTCKTKFGLELKLLFSWLFILITFTPLHWRGLSVLYHLLAHDVDGSSSWMYHRCNVLNKDHQAAISHHCTTHWSAFETATIWIRNTWIKASVTDTE